MPDQASKCTKESIANRNEGNKLYRSRNHNKKIHLEILSLYNESVVKAENNSEELALAISNRSALLMHLKMYKESIDDIEKSCQITKSEELKIKLLTRKMKCYSLMEKADQDKKLSEDIQDSQFSTINKVSKTIPCAADCITITYDKKYGRCIVATEDIKPGTIIVKEKVDVVYPYAPKTFMNCAHCLMLATNGIPCNSCAFVIYCSEQCKEKAWLQYHDLECLIVRHMKYESYFVPINTLARLKLTFRLFIKFIKEEGFQNMVQKIEKITKNNSEDGNINGFFENGLFQSHKFQSFYNLNHDVFLFKQDIENSYSEPIITRFAQILIKKTNVLKDYGKAFNKTDKDLFDFVKEIIHRMKFIVKINAHSIGDKWGSDEEETIIGISIGTLSCIFNHSCLHYTGQNFTKNELHIYTLKFVKKGEQIFLNYGAPLGMEKPVRQNEMMCNYNFICECEPCKDEWPVVHFCDCLDKRWKKSDVAELVSEFKKNNVSNLSIKIFKGEVFNKIPFNEIILEDISIMSRIIQEKFPGFQSFVYYSNILQYIDEYFSKFSVKIYDIPDTC